MGRGESAHVTQADALSDSNACSRRSAIIALLLLVPAPTVGVLLAMYLLPGSALGQGSWAVSKIWLLALPAVWCKWVDHQRWSIPSPRRGGWWAGLITGIAIFIVIYAAFGLVNARGWIDAAFVSEAARSRGLKSPMLFVGMAVYWCTINSLLEEYVWRWFVFTRSAALTGARPAIFISALLFTVHHIFTLAIYFDWRLTVLASLGVCIGGATWAWIYMRYRNIYAAWLSHVGADLAIFVIGYRLIFS